MRVKKGTSKKRTMEEMIEFLQKKGSATATRIKEDENRVRGIKEKIARLEIKIELKAERARQKEEVRLRIEGLKQKIKELREGKEDVI